MALLGCIGSSRALAGLAESAELAAKRVKN